MREVHSVLQFVQINSDYLVAQKYTHVLFWIVLYTSIFFACNKNTSSKKREKKLKQYTVYFVLIKIRILLTTCRKVIGKVRHTKCSIMKKCKMVSVFTQPDVNTREVRRTRDKRRKPLRFASWFPAYRVFSQPPVCLHQAM